MPRGPWPHGRPSRARGVARARGGRRGRMRRRRRRRDDVMSTAIVLIPGDGIGPEVTDAARRVLAAAGADIRWVERHAGIAALDRGSDTTLPKDTVDAILEHGV